MCIQCFNSHLSRTGYLLGAVSVHKFLPYSTGLHCSFFLWTMSLIIK